jgi:hypothetical protein
MEQAALAASAGAMRGIPINIYLQTAQGKALCASKNYFAYEGKLWQGVGRSAVIVPPHLLTEQEYARILDIDGTMTTVQAAVKSRQSIIDKRTRDDQEKRDAVEAEREERKLRLIETKRRLGVYNEKPGDRVVVSHNEELGEDLPSHVPPQINPADPASQFRLPVGTHEAITSAPQPSGPAPEAPSIATDVKLDAVLHGLGELTSLLTEVLKRDEVDEVHAANALPADPEPVACDECHKPVPPGRDPVKWVAAHKRGAHRKK